MGLYQCDIQLVPYGAVTQPQSSVDVVVTEDGLDTSGWWLSNQPDAHYSEIISRSFAAIESWCQDWQRWGDEEQILIETFVDGCRVEGIGARVDVRNVNIELLERLVTVVKELECKIYIMETQHVINAELKELSKALRESKAEKHAKLETK